ncbi:MAG: hypothetical protein AABX66_03405 [Nanoarchaeota archaeon]
MKNGKAFILLFAFVFLFSCFLAEIQVSALTEHSGKIIFERNGSMESDSSLTYNKEAQTLEINSFIGNITVSDVKNISPAVVNYGDSQGKYISDYIEHQIKVYAYKDVGDKRIFSMNPITSLLFVDDGFSNRLYSINWTWEAVPDADGYLVFKYEQSQLHAFSYNVFVYTNTNNLYDYSSKIFTRSFFDISLKSIQTEESSSISINGNGIFKSNNFKFINLTNSLTDIISGRMFANSFCINETNCLSLPNGINGGIQFFSKGILSSDINLFWDTKNKRLGLGTNNPQAMLHIVSTDNNSSVESVKKINGDIISYTGSYNSSLGCSHQVQICAYKDLSTGGRVYSDNCPKSKLVTFDEIGYKNYQINWVWDFVENADGYRILYSNNCSGYSFDHYKDFNKTNSLVMETVVNESYSTYTYMIQDKSSVDWILGSEITPKSKDYYSVDALRVEGNVVILGNITAQNICYSNGTNCANNPSSLNGMIKNNTYVGDVGVFQTINTKNIIVEGRKGITKTLVLSKTCKVVVIDGVIVNYVGCV